MTSAIAILEVATLATQSIAARIFVFPAPFFPTNATIDVKASSVVFSHDRNDSIVTFLSCGGGIV